MKQVRKYFPKPVHTVNAFHIHRIIFVMRMEVQMFGCSLMVKFDKKCQKKVDGWCLIEKSVFVRLPDLCILELIFGPASRTSCKDGGLFPFHFRILMKISRLSKSWSKANKTHYANEISRKNGWFQTREVEWIWQWIWQNDQH